MTGSNRSQVLWMNVAYILVLALLAALYFNPTLPAALSWLAWLRPPAAFGDMPSGVLWFGALGGVLISLVGVHEHRHDWDNDYWSWHLVRPFVGAAVGIVAVLIVMSGILATGVNPNTTATDAAETTPRPLDLFYFVVAFLVGYREYHFRGMIKRVGDVIFTSTTQGTAPTISGLSPSSGPTGSDVSIMGADFTDVEAVMFGSVYADFTVVSAQEITTKAPKPTDATSTEPTPVSVTTASGRATGKTYAYEVPAE